MIDRIINLLTLLIVFLVLIVLGTNLRDSWMNSEPWEQKWVAKVSLEQKFDSERFITAIRTARSLGEYSDAYKLEEALKSKFEPSGEVLVRFNDHEIENIAGYVFSTLFLFIVPISINYVRHGKFKLWNRSA